MNLSFSGELELGEREPEALVLVRCDESTAEHVRCPGPGNGLVDVGAESHGHTIWERTDRSVASSGSLSWAQPGVTPRSFLRATSEARAHVEPSGADQRTPQSHAVSSDMTYFGPS